MPLVVVGHLNRSADLQLSSGCQRLQTWNFMRTDMLLAIRQDHCKHDECAHNRQLSFREQDEIL